MRLRDLARAALLAALVAQLGCLAPPNVCRGDPGGPTPDADAVCDHLAALGCLAGPIPEYVDGGPEAGVLEVPFDAAGADLQSVHANECRAGYASFRASLGPASFDALARCYGAARSCEEVEACNRGCPLLTEDGGTPDAPPVPLDAGPPDASLSLDGGTPDAPLSLDGGTPDAPLSLDGGTPDAPVSLDGGA